jgi:IS4 transposase
MKENASFVVVESRCIPDGSRVRADEIIVFTKQAAEDEGRFFRRVVWWDEEGKRELVYLTNHLDLEAATVAALYKARWKVELFIKSIKPNLRIKTFVGTSAKALKIQIGTALIALLLVRFLDYPFEAPLLLRPDYQPDQPLLLTPSDEPSEGQP